MSGYKRSVNGRGPSLLSDPESLRRSSNSFFPSPVTRDFRLGFGRGIVKGRFGVPSVVLEGVVYRVGGGGRG